jgi:hypothetical protein
MVKRHSWWEPWQHSLRLINTFAAHSTAALVIIILAGVLEYIITNIERGEKITAGVRHGVMPPHPNALDIIHYGDLTVLVGIVGILGYKLLKWLSTDGK